jgi:hypothetical protein
MANGQGGSRNRGKTWSWTPEARAAHRVRLAERRKLNNNHPKIKLEPKIAAEPKKSGQRPWFSQDAVMAIIEASKEHARRNRPRTPDWNPYIIRPERFGPVVEHIKRHHPAMAMDSVSRGGAKADQNVIAMDQANQFAVQAWQAGGMLNNVASEGLLFLGYPYLSELAQRPEFRLFGEIRAEEMTRRWIEFRGTDDESTKEKDKPKARNKDDQAKDFAQGNEEEQPGRSDSRNKEIEAKIKELEDFAADIKLKDWFKAAAAQDSFFGISHLYLDLKGVDIDNLRDPELTKDIGNGRNAVTEAKFKGTKGFLKGLRTIEAIWCYPTVYNAVNPLIPTWYDPQVWYVMGTEIHKSRLLSFIGQPVPDILRPAYAFGGLSMTQMAQPYVDIWLRTRESVGEIIHAFSVMILSTKLATTTMPGGSGGGNGDVLARMMLANMLRDNQGMMVIDKETEEFSNVAAPISGLDHLQAQAQEHLCSVGRIPLVKYTGISPSGLNATSEYEMRSFNDTTHGAQEHLFRGHLTTVTDLMQMSLWGERDPDITWDFLPLQELTPKEKAEVRKLDAETDQIRIDSGVVWQEEVREKIVADPESGFEGLDPEDVPDLLLEEEQGLEPEGGRPQPQAEKGEEAQGEDGGIQNFDDAEPESVLRRDRVIEAGGTGA